MEIKTLKSTELKDLLQAFNSSFTNYFVPLKYNLEQLQSKIARENIDLDLSIGVFKDDLLVAFMLHGVDTVNGEKAIYNAGTGVIPEERSNGLSQKMYEFIIPILKDQQFSYSILEVISENQAARKSYENSGYKPIRDLWCYYGKPSVSKSNLDIQIREMKEFNWDLMKSFWDISPSWQNSQYSLSRVEEKLVSLAAYLGEKQVAYILFNPEKNRVLQLAVSKDYRNLGVASSLIKEIVTNYSSTISINNIDEKGSCLHGFLNFLGLESEIKQIEMKLNLKG